MHQLAFLKSSVLQLSCWWSPHTVKDTGVIGRVQRRFIQVVNNTAIKSCLVDLQTENLFELSTRPSDRVRQYKLYKKHSTLHEFNIFLQTFCK